VALGVPSQLAHALWHGPLALAKLRRRGWTWFAVYLLLCALILGVVARLLVAYKGDLVEVLVRYVFPTDWAFAGRMLVDRLIDAQDPAVIVNAAIGASLVVVQVLLFPVKEQLSATFEREASLVAEPGRSLSLVVEAWEEIKLFLAFVAAQMSIFWIGYSSDPARKELAMALSYLYLFGSFGVDFLTPVLQRHGHRYGTMLKVLALHPVMVLAFGALFSLPPIVVGRLVVAHPGVGFAAAVSALFAANVVAIAWAAVAGTQAGAQLLTDARSMSRPSVFTRLFAWAVLLGLLAWNGWRFGRVGLAIHHKSQILKCEYDVDWSSIDVDRPGALDLVFGVRDDAVEVGVHFDVTIDNPTRFDVVIENNRLEALHHGEEVAETSLTPLAVPAGGTATARVAFPLKLRPSQLLKGRELLDGGEWAITWWIEVGKGFWFPIYLMEAKRS
jgi:hypothetical protein